MYTSTAVLVRYSSILYFIRVCSVLPSTVRVHTVHTALSVFLLYLTLLCTPRTLWAVQFIACSIWRRV